MKVLLVHNAYRQRGGEDAVVQAEAELLRNGGIEVIEYRRGNDELVKVSGLRAAVETAWSGQTVDDTLRLISEHRPQLVHVHNTLSRVSPSVYWAASRAGLPVVQTLHNFRLLCPQAMLLREGRICEDCVGRAPWAGVRHACYQGSRLRTAVLAGAMQLHKGLGTWTHKIHRYIALNEFCRAKFIEGGLPSQRISVKPNFIDLPGAAEQPRNGLLYVGRLSHEKGIATLADAAATLPAASIRVVGTGPEAHRLEGRPAFVELGSLSLDAVIDEMRSASALVMPSVWYENFPRTLVEAFASGLPVIASRLGAMAELIEDGVTGLLVDVASPTEWSQKMRWALAHPAEMRAMGVAARAVYEAKYSAKVNLETLLAIYQQAQDQLQADLRHR